MPPAWTVSALWAALKGAVLAFFKEWLFRKHDADAGAQSQRETNDQANAVKVTEAEKRHEASGTLSDADLRARAERDWLRPD